MGRKSLTSNFRCVFFWRRCKWRYCGPPLGAFSPCLVSCLLSPVCPACGPLVRRRLRSLSSLPLVARLPCAFAETAYGGLGCLHIECVSFWRRCRWMYCRNFHRCRSCRHSLVSTRFQSWSGYSRIHFHVKISLRASSFDRFTSVPLFSRRFSAN